MIFVTVGSQLPFDRMIEAVDELAPLFGDQEIIAQVYGMKYKPANIKCLDYIEPKDYSSYIQKADLVLAHAGTGTILSVSQMEKPLIVFPRLGKLKETRNDHQLATCRMLEKTCGLQVAYEKDQLKDKIISFMEGKLPIMQKIPAVASEELTGSIRSFILAGKEQLAFY